MIDPSSGPFLFDTSAESWLARPQESQIRNWFGEYLGTASSASPIRTGRLGPTIVKTPSPVSTPSRNVLISAK